VKSKNKLSWSVVFEQERDRDLREIFIDLKKQCPVNHSFRATFTAEDVRFNSTVEEIRIRKIYLGNAGNMMESYPTIRIRKLASITEPASIEVFFEITYLRIFGFISFFLASVCVWKWAIGFIDTSFIPMIVISAWIIVLIWLPFLFRRMLKEIVFKLKNVLIKK
jgi:hypothetical protein